VISERVSSRSSSPGGSLGLESPGLTIPNAEVTQAVPTTVNDLLVGKKVFEENEVYKK